MLPLGGHKAVAGLDGSSNVFVYAMAKPEQL